MASEYYAMSNEPAVVGAEKFGTPAEDLFRARRDVDVTWWFDTRGRGIQASSNSRITEWSSRVFRNDFQKPKAVSPSEALGVYYSNSLNGTRDEYLFGIGLDGNVISGSNNRSMDGVNDSFQLPGTGDVTIAMLVRLLTPSNLTVLLAGQATDTQLVLAVTSGMAVRAYANYSASPLGSTGTIDNNEHLLIWKFDRSGNTCEMIRDTTQIRAPSAFTLPNYANPNLQFGHVTEGVTPTFGAGFAIQTAACINSIDDVSLDLLRDVLDERAP